MSEPTPIGATAEPLDGDWRVRRATAGDVQPIAAAARELLFELGGRPAPGPDLQEAARALVEDEGAGALFVADAGGRIVGFLGVSWQMAVRVPGRYGLIQELWVHPGWRGQTIGGELISALCELALEQGIGRIEVGLPSERFPHVQATEAFYEVNKFIPIGMRMRRLLR